MCPRKQMGRWMTGEVAARSPQVGREVCVGAGAAGSGGWRWGAFGGSAARRSGARPRDVRKPGRKAGVREPGRKASIRELGGGSVRGLGREAGVRELGRWWVTKMFGTFGARRATPFEKHNSVHDQRTTVGR